jgi:hypothetical protein
MISWIEGFGNWTYTGDEGIAVELLIELGTGSDGDAGTGNVQVQLGVSNTGTCIAETC